MGDINNAVPSPGANPKAAQTNIKFQSAARCGGQRAHDLRSGPQPSYVDTKRSDKNRVLIEPISGTELRRVCEERRALRKTKRAMKSNASVAVSGVVSFGIEAQVMFEKLSAARQDEAFFEVATEIADLLGTDLTGLVVHCDETAIHAHFQYPAFNRSGQPVSDIAKRGSMRQMQDITARVMQKYAPDIERGTSRARRMTAGETYSETMHKNVAQLHHELPAELAALQAKIDAAREKETKNEERAEKARIKADKLEQDANTAADKLAKAQKNVETYERRASEARTAAGEAEAERDRIEKLISEIKQRKATVEADLEITEQAKAKAKDDLETAEIQKIEVEKARDEAEADLESTEKAKTEAETATAREVERQEKQGSWSERAAGNLSTALNYAVDGTFHDKVGADMTGAAQFDTLSSASDGLPTFGFWTKFWSLNHSITGTSASADYLAPKLRAALESAFGKVGAFAKEFDAAKTRLSNTQTQVAKAEAELAQKKTNVAGLKSKKNSLGKILEDLSA